ncbi:MAG: hypothetical protein AAF213_05005 [Pseudomonadota bacterium]
MKRNVTAAVLGSALLAGTSLSLVPNNALACGCLPPAYASTVGTSTGAIGAGFGMLTLMISQSFGALNASLSAQGSSTAEVASRQNSEMTQLARYEARHDLVTDFTFAHDPCIAYDATTRSGVKSMGARQTTQQLGAANDAAAQNLTDDTSGSPAQNAAKRIENMNELYCGELAEEIGLCDTPPDREELRDAHIKALYFTKDTLDEELALAANNFARTLAGPVPPAATSADYNSPGGIRRINQRATRDARVDTMMETWEYLVGLKKDVGEDDAGLAQALREHISGTDDPELNGSNTETQKQSLYELMALQNEYRFKDAAWVEGIMGVTPTELSLLKELAVMEATGLFTEWKRFELDQRIAGNLSVILATKADEVYERTN